MAPFTDTEHIFQNMGDGTYAHSGSLAIRYAASTERQHHLQAAAQRPHLHDRRPGHHGRHPVANMVSESARQRRAKRSSSPPTSRSNYQGVQPGEWPHRGLAPRPPGRSAAELAATPGTTVLIHDQECAAELRRARSRGKAEEPVEVTVINERVCEGCGDCGEKSNCMSVEPVDPEFGRKTRIHQSSCNKDFSCVKGFCPSFLTITPVPQPQPGMARKRRRAAFPPWSGTCPPVFKKWTTAWASAST
jgi:indolepyruvate ferredoxin oxidoreductase